MINLSKKFNKLNRVPDEVVDFIREYIKIL